MEFPCQILIFVFFFVFSLFGGALKSKAAKKNSQTKKKNGDVEKGLSKKEKKEQKSKMESKVSTINMPENSDQEFSDDLDHDLSDSRLNSWDEDFSYSKGADMHFTKEDLGYEDESARNYTEDALDEMGRDPAKMKYEIGGSLDGEKDGKEKGIMKGIDMISSDTYLTRVHRSMACENPEFNGGESKLKLSEMLDTLPFRPLLILQREAITNKNHADYFHKRGKICHKDPPSKQRIREEMDNLKLEMEKKYANLYVKFDDKTPTYITYGYDPTRGSAQHKKNEEDTMDIDEEEQNMDEKKDK